MTLNYFSNTRLTHITFDTMNVSLLIYSFNSYTIEFDIPHKERLANQVNILKIKCGIKSSKCPKLRRCLRRNTI